MKILSVLFLLMFFVSVGCSPLCHRIEIEEMQLECDSPAVFLGESYFNSRATFHTFLAQQCLYLPESETLIKEKLDSVDFDKNAVFVATGPANIISGKCITERKIDKVESCDTAGLKIFFIDEAKSIAKCSEGRWLTAFVLSQKDLNEAISQGEIGEANDRQSF